MNNNEYGWLITHGVSTDPENRLFGGFKVNVEGKGNEDGDDGIPGKCNGSAFTAIR